MLPFSIIVDLYDDTLEPTGTSFRMNWVIRVSLTYLLITGCAITPAKLQSQADAIAHSSALERTVVQTPDFKLTGYRKIHPNMPHIQTARIYIEGDGHGWITPTQLSSNPTPHHPLALKLAVLDSHPKVFYLARPCQYTPLTQEKNCHPAIWSSDRFSEPVLHSINHAITEIKRDMQVNSIDLIGFSGGAAIATLIAARRNDIRSIRTVAGDLDHVRMTEYHKTTPLKNALNPKDVVAKIASIPQHHFAGANDVTVPPFISEEFQEAGSKIQDHCIHRSVLPGISHLTGWEKRWPSLLNARMDCTSPDRGAHSQANQ